MSRIFIYPKTSEQELNPLAPFPQVVLYRTFATGQRIYRVYEACGCWRQTESALTEDCQFHKGRGHCFWNSEEQLAELFKMLTALQQQPPDPDRDWSIQRVYKDMTFTLNRLKKE